MTHAAAISAAPAAARSGGFPLALLVWAHAGGVAMGIAAGMLGASTLGAVFLGWLSAVALVPALPFAPVVGKLFWNDPAAQRAADARDLDAWSRDLDAEAEAVRGTRDAA